LAFLSKPRREIYKRKIKNFWIDFSHNKVGFAGLVIIIGFVILAIIAPLLTPYLPMSQRYKSPKLAMPYAVPEWFRIFPQYHDYNPTIKIEPELSNATVVEQSGPISVDMNNLFFNFTPSGKIPQKASVTLDLGNFSYMYGPPPTFTMHLAYNMVYNKSQVTIYFIIQNYTANPLYEEYFKDPTKAEMKVFISVYTPNETQQSIDSNIDSFIDAPFFPVLSSLYKPDAEKVDPARIIFSQKGTYGLKIKVEFKSLMPPPKPGSGLLPTAEGAYAHFFLKKIGITIWGRCHGILGTQSGGHDVWTELVYGARISLMVGLLAAALSTSIGILYGVFSGYIGGFVDNFLMRVVDILLCIPVLPILLVLVNYFAASVYIIIILIAIFGWQGLSRVIRSRVLTLKEMAFIEAARASGASDGYLILHHLIPNVMPIAMAAMVLSIPGAIITEASLSFLGFGDPNVPTWGRILYDAYQQGGLPAWWVWLPPGFAIVLICLGFVFIGHAVDEIVNPRLRRRR